MGWESKPSYGQRMRLVSYRLTTLQSKTGAPRRYCPDLSSLEDWCITFVLVARGDWGRVSNLHRPLRFTKPMRRYLRLPGATRETAPGLAPGKSRVAACRLDGFGIAVMETGERRWDLHPHRRLHRRSASRLHHKPTDKWSRRQVTLLLECVYKTRASLLCHAGKRSCRPSGQTELPDGFARLIGWTARKLAPK